MKTDRPLDLARIKRALANLDRIAADHPELCGDGPKWTEDDVAEIIVDDAGAEGLDSGIGSSGRLGRDRAGFSLPCPITRTTDTQQPTALAGLP